MILKKRLLESRDLIDGLKNGELVDSETPVRNVMLVAQFASGVSIADLSAQIEQSERVVRDRLRDSLPCEIYEVTDALNDIEEHRERQEVKKNKKLVREWSRDNEGRPLSVAAELLGLQEAQVDALVGTRRKFHRQDFMAEFQAPQFTALAPNHPTTREIPEVETSRPTTPASITAIQSEATWTGEMASLPTEPIATIQECSQDVRVPLTREKFDEWSSDRSLASSQDFIDRTSCSWAELLRASGVTGLNARNAEKDSYAANDWASSIRPEALSVGEICETAKLDQTDYENAAVLLHRLRQGIHVRTETSVRDRKIISQFALGYTLEKVGKNFGVTRERIRQIVSRQSSATSAQIKEALRVEGKFYQTRRAMAERKALHAWSEANIGEPVSSAVTVFELPEARIRKALGPRRKFHVRKRNSARKTFENQQLIRLVQEFYEETGSTVSSEFDDWSRARGGPSRQTVMIRYEKWSYALEAAGVAEGGEVARSRLFTKRDCWACILEYLQIPDSKYTFADFERWTNADEDKPSSATIRNRLGVPWSDMVDTGLSILAGTADSELGNRWMADIKRNRDWSRLREERQVSTVDPQKLVSEAFDEQGYPLTIARYNEWADEFNKPNANKILNTSGEKWNDILVNAGIQLSARQIARGKS